MRSFSVQDVKDAELPASCINFLVAWPGCGMMCLYVFECVGQCWNVMNVLGSLGAVTWLPRTTEVSVLDWPFEIQKLPLAECTEKTENSHRKGFFQKFVSGKKSL